MHALLTVLLLAGCGHRGPSPDGEAEERTDTGVPDRCPDVPWKQIATGDLLSCGVKEDGCVTCWGNIRYSYESHGCEGGEDTGCRFTDYHEDEPPAVPAVQVALSKQYGFSGLWGSWSACLLGMDGVPTCWGRNDWRQTAEPDTELASVGVDYYTGAGVTPEGDLVLWGTPENRAFRTSGIPSGITRLSYVPGLDHLCWIDEGGDAGCFTAFSGDIWFRSSESFPGASTVVDIDAYGGSFMEIGTVCIVTATGALECTSRTKYVVPGEYPRPPISFEMTEFCFSLDAWWACALDSDRLPQCWTTLRTGLKDMDTTEARALGLPLHGLECGRSHACALTEAGEAVCWGDDMAGQSSPPGSYVLARGRGVVPR